ncbi:Hypothetical predicted protein [Cloeon dipterum]|uniref:Transposase domain-containing protein n=1 Tax=Cloeon dipterum TaxID=197152 RepID=A0A8S1CQB1_9INSE|nr:Hypothetical predicted protein [Cloeon dipterum]
MKNSSMVMLYIDSSEKRQRVDGDELFEEEFEEESTTTDSFDNPVDSSGDVYDYTTGGESLQEPVEDETQRDRSHEPEDGFSDEFFEEQSDEEGDGNDMEQCENLTSNESDMEEEADLEDQQCDILSTLRKLPNDPLFQDGPSIAELTVSVLSVLIKHSSPDALKIDLFGVMNVAFKTRLFPDTQYQLKKLYAPILIPMRQHLFCKSCYEYAGCTQKGKDAPVCPKCKREVKKSVKDENFFYTSDLNSTFKNLLEKNSARYNGKFLETPSSRGEKDEKLFKDVADGSVHLKLRGRFGTDINTYNFFGDAAPAFEASKKSIFSLMISPNFLDKADRCHQVTLGAIWVGRKEPPMDIICLPFVKDAARIATHGVDWKDHDGKERNTKLLPLVAIADTVARPKLIGSAVHNAPFGCFLCHHPNDECGQAYNRFTVRDPAPTLRSHQSWQRDLKEAIETGEPTRGVKKDSIIAKLPGFEIPENVGAEAMHAGDIGHTKTLLKIWSANYRDPFYIFSPYKRAKIDEYIHNVRLPSLSSSRLMTGISDFRTWKASQAKTWALHLSLPILTDLQQTEHLAIWGRYISAYWRLCKSSISESDILEAQLLLEEVSHGHQLLYGKTAMTSNLHQTLHWPVTVTRLGPLTEYTAYPYEGKFPAIKRDVTSTKGTSQQVMERALLREMLPIAAEELLQEDLKDFTLKILERKKRKLACPPEVRGARKEETASFFKYHKAVVNGYVIRSFESQKYKNTDKLGQ